MVANERNLVCVLSFVAVTLSIGCPAYHSLDEWQRQQELWTNATGSTVALYDRPTALSRNPEVIVCESRTANNLQRRVIASVPRDAFPLVFGNRLYIYDLRTRATPGWYRIERNHSLTWWQRVFSNEPLGTLGEVQAPTGIDRPPAPQMYGGVFALRGRDLYKVADESGVGKLWDVPAEGFVFVAEPGIAVRQSFDLVTECR